jgi:hypothetical protein
MEASIYLNFTIVMIALISSCAIYFQPPSNLYLKVFPVFMLITTISGGLLNYLALKGKNNVLPSNIYSVFELCFYFYILSQIIQNKKMKRVILWVLFIYPILAFINIFYIQGTAAFHTSTFCLGALLVVAFCVYYFFELFQRPVALNLFREPAFWICSGLLFYFSCSFPLFGFSNSLKRSADMIYAHLGVIFNLLDSLLYSSFTIAFLCRIKTRKSI